MNEGDLLGRTNPSYQANNFPTYQSFPGEAVNQMLLNPFSQNKADPSLQNQGNAIFMPYIPQPQYPAQNTNDQNLSQASMQFPNYLKMKQPHNLPIDSNNAGFVLDNLNEKNTRGEAANSNSPPTAMNQNNENFFLGKVEEASHFSK